MTVNEMIAILSKHDGDMTVLVEGYEQGLCDAAAENINQMRYFENRNKEYWEGPHEPGAQGDCVGLVIGRGAYVGSKRLFA